MPNTLSPSQELKDEESLHHLPYEELEQFARKMAEEVKAERVSQWTFYSTLKKRWPQLSEKEVETTVIKALSGDHRS